MGFIILGLVAGILSGLVGLGGGSILIPALIYFFGLNQHQAQGTTLAIMIPPIGILAAWTYYKHGYVDLKITTLIIVGFIIGGWIGAKAAVNIPTIWLKKIFAASLIIIGIKMLF